MAVRRLACSTGGGGTEMTAGLAGDPSQGSAISRVRTANLLGFYKPSILFSYHLPVILNGLAASVGQRKILQLQYCVSIRVLPQPV